MYLEWCRAAAGITRIQGSPDCSVSSIIGISLFHSFTNKKHAIQCVLALLHPQTSFCLASCPFLPQQCRFVQNWWSRMDDVHQWPVPGAMCRVLLHRGWVCGACSEPWPPHLKDLISRNIFVWRSFHNWCILSFFSPVDSTAKTLWIILRNSEGTKLNCIFVI